MNNSLLWTDPIYLQTVKIILGFLFVCGIFLFIVRNKNTHLQAAWASIQSWLIAAPFMLFIFSFQEPWPLICVTLVAIAGAKNFFQMTGIYHRSFFVWSCYIGIVALSVCIFYRRNELYDLMPMLLLGVISLIPIFRNTYNRMIQYMALTIMCFIFLGWSLMHLGKMLVWEKGILIALYLYILTEVSDNFALAFGRFFGNIRPFKNINPRVTLEGVLIASVFTFLLAWGMRHLLPHREEKYWIASAIIVVVFGRLGDLLLSVIRRDLGQKDVGLFILGRGDLLSRLDQMIFVAPIFYYAFQWLPYLQV